jgi:hypothetical protein
MTRLWVLAGKEKDNPGTEKGQLNYNCAMTPSI